ncbi:MAG: GGDEF domain-containing protein, partial [bacterium]|nr:GGDEF domain-containing protein [bacterium]
AMEHELQRSALERLETEALDVVIVRDGPEALAAYAMRDASAKLLGALTLSMCHHSLEPLHRRTLVDLAACLAPLIAEARMILNERAEAARDPLTDTLNRKAIESALQGVLSDPLRACECIVLLIDIDHFKRINDALGHKAGDRCLRELASAVRQRLRSGDHLGRLGGDEFLAVLPATKLGVAKGIIDRLVRTDLSAVIHADGRSVTLSIGVIAPRPGESIEEVLERADRALYLAKRGGRHRTVFAGFEESGD